MNYFSRSIVLFATLISFYSYGQTEVGGVALLNTIKINENTLELNGGGIREKYWIDLYVGGLYLSEKGSDAQKIIDANEPMAIYMEIVSTLITSEKMIESVDEGFKKSTKGNTKPIQEKIETFKKAFLEPIKEKDTYTISYSPPEGVSVSKNGKHIATIDGLDFKKALFGIWLCDDPADEDLKEGMLGLE
ncbi:MAG TPA: chalcone isomerase [Flavobacteriales bacterium]|nr:chalcone isomerase [Flavobacteriales bacterium]HIN38873.1 chalcone isomerase [Flavobacteriales bacterium]